MDQKCWESIIYDHDLMGIYGGVDWMHRVVTEVSSVVGVPSIYLVNHIFYVIENLYNFADDNVLSCSEDSLQEVSNTLMALNWVGNNLMGANPGKFASVSKLRLVIFVLTYVAVRLNTPNEWSD